MATWARRASSIRTSVVLLVIIAVTPLLVDRIRLVEAERQARIQDGTAAALAYARRAARKQDDLVIAARAVLQTAAHATDQLPALGGPACNRFLADAASDVPWMRSISIASPDGRIQCASNPTTIGTDISDRRYFRDMLERPNEDASSFVLTGARSAPAVIVAYAKPNPYGGVRSVLTAMVDLRWFAQFDDVVREHPTARILLTDAAGAVLSAYPEPQAWIGRDLSGDPVMRDIASRHVGIVTAAAFGDARRFWGFHPVAGTGVHLLVGLSEHDVLAGVDREVANAYVKLALVGLLVLLGAWFFGEFAILRPVHRLTRFAVRVGRGDLSGRTAGTEWASEFAPLTRALDGMAAQLAMREENLRLERDGFAQLAAVDSLTGLPNRRGFDAQMLLEWNRAATGGRSLALLMLDVDHFKAYNDLYGHVQGDACLRQIGDTLRAITGAAAFAARFGGEEFAVLIADADADAAMRMAERARRAVEACGIAHSHSPFGHVTVSVGVAALTPMAGSEPALLIEAADAALYASKRLRNTVTMAGPQALAQAC